MIKDGEVVGHAPATKIFQFLRRDVNKAFVEVTGTKVNRDWKFHAYGQLQSAFIHRMKDCRLGLFTLQDTLSLHSHHLHRPTCTSQSQQLQSILYEILSGWSFVIGGFLGVEFRCWRFFWGGVSLLEVFYKVKVQLGALLVAVVRCWEVVALWRLLIHGVNGSANPFQQLWPL